MMKPTQSRRIAALQYLAARHRAAGRLQKAAELETRMNAAMGRAEKKGHGDAAFDAHMRGLERAYGSHRFGEAISRDWGDQKDYAPGDHVEFHPGMDIFAKGILGGRVTSKRKGLFYVAPAKRGGLYDHPYEPRKRVKADHTYLRPWGRGWEPRPDSSVRESVERGFKSYKDGKGFVITQDGEPVAEARVTAGEPHVVFYGDIPPQDSDVFRGVLREAGKALGFDGEHGKMSEAIKESHDKLAAMLAQHDRIHPQYRHAYSTRADLWVPAAGGHETPFTARSGKKMLYVYNPKHGKHAYLDVDSDMLMTDHEAHAHMEPGKPQPRHAMMSPADKAHFHRRGINLPASVSEVLDYRMKKRDRKVVLAFANRKPGKSAWPETDGRRLWSNGLGGATHAYWEKPGSSFRGDSGLRMGDAYGHITQTLHNAIRRATGTKQPRPSRVREALSYPDHSDPKRSGGTTSHGQNIGWRYSKRLRVGDRVQISGGSGIDSDKTGVVHRLGGDGYHHVKLDDGSHTVMHKHRLRRVAGVAEAHGWNFPSKYDERGWAEAGDPQHTAYRLHKHDNGEYSVYHDTDYPHRGWSDKIGGPFKTPDHAWSAVVKDRAKRYGWKYTTSESTSRRYVGVKHGHKEREVFWSSAEPTEASHGHKYAYVIGPFPSSAGANLMAHEYKKYRPENVTHAERLAKRYARSNESSGGHGWNGPFGPSHAPHWLADDPDSEASGYKATLRPDSLGFRRFHVYHHRHSDSGYGRDTHLGVHDTLTDAWRAVKKHRSARNESSSGLYEYRLPSQAARDARLKRIRRGRRRNLWYVHPRVRDILSRFQRANESEPRRSLRRR